MRSSSSALIHRLPGGARHVHLLAMVCLLAATWFGISAATAPERVAPAVGIAEQCAACHEQPVNEWAMTVHRRTVGAPHIAADQQGCGACHHGLAAHLEDPAVTPAYLGQASGEQVNAICLSCHRGGGQMLWHSTSHSKLAQGCLECHAPHGGQGRTMLRTAQPDLCGRCHPGEAAEMHLPSHHPVPEGKMTCTDCHNVHGDARNLLPAESTAEMCYRCHAEKAGPFLYEHPPVTEDCAICHKPHGAQNDRLLRVDEPLLCLQCHPGHHASRRGPLIAVGSSSEDQQQALDVISGFYSRCTSCHSLIHGTDLPTSTNAPGTNEGNLMPGRPPAATLPLGSTRSFNSGPFWGLSGLAAMSLRGDGAAWGFSDYQLGSIDEKGNPTYVREYDGKNYEFSRITLARSQYSATTDFHLEVRDPAANDASVEAHFGSPTVSGTFKYDELTHRLPRFNDVTGPLRFPGTGGGTYSLDVTDLTQGKQDFALERKVTDIALAARHPKLRSVKWLARYWRESEVGDQQFLFLDRSEFEDRSCSVCHKFQTSQPINRVTTQASGGAEIAADRGVLRYLRTEGRFENRAPEQEFFFGVGARPPIFIGEAPLFGVADHRTRADEVRLVAAPISALTVNAMWRKHDRDNLYNGFSLGMDTIGGSLNWRLAPGLRLTASRFATDLNNAVRVEDPDTGQIALDGISRDRDITRAELRYTGLRGAALSAGFKREEVERFTLFEKVPRSSKTDTWNLNALTRLPRGGSLTLRFREASTDHRPNVPLPGPPQDFSRWIGLPTDEQVWSAVATYGLAPGLLGSVLYSNAHRHFTIEDAPLQVLRQAHEDITSAGAELHYGAGRRTKLTAGYYQQEGEARSDVTYGVADFTLAPPLTPGDESIVFPPIDSVANLDYTARILRFNASHWLAPRVRLFGRYDRTRSDGRTLANNLGDYIDQNPDLQGVAILLNPFDITLKDWWLGAGYLLDPYTEVALSFQKREWENRHDATQDGSYDLWRLGVRKQF